MSNQDHSDSPDPTHRRDRAAIAAQACQTCRNRKSKCDEQRPKCGLCKRLSVECQYREPQPTKKDKTMMQILESLQRLEKKFDDLAVTTSKSTPTLSIDQVDGLPESAVTPRDHTSTDVNSEIISAADQFFPRELQRSYRHLTAAHKILLWPAVYLHIINLGPAIAHDLRSLLQEGTHWLINVELAKHPVPLSCSLERTSLFSNGVATTRVSSLGLTMESISLYTNAYFSTFNIVHPILDRDAFFVDTVEPIIRNGFVDTDPSASLALLVFALGQVAIDGVHGAPISYIKGVASGLRGGTADEPPGLGFFNEARKRIGFILAQCTLENVQIYLLQATYFEACARHMDFWRMTVAASMVCQVLIRCEQIDWSTQRGDMIKKSYWCCILAEDLYHLELDLPSTGIHDIEDTVPLPFLQEVKRTSRASVEDRSHYQYHFLAMIALRRLITRIHKQIHGADDSSESSEDYGGPPLPVVKELIRQLDSWRSLLPQPLQWSDDDSLSSPDTSQSSRWPKEPMFSVDQKLVPAIHQYNTDIITGQLRTRFYYARFMIYRPFVYKALHFQELMSAEDAEYAALAVEAACLWPLSLAPPKNKKRLVPHLFTWTQSFLGILLVLRMAAENNYLRELCERRVSKYEMEQTARFLMDWIRDVKQVDGVAEWAWNFLEPLYVGRA